MGSAICIRVHGCHDLGARRADLEDKIKALRGASAETWDATKEAGMAAWARVEDAHTKAMATPAPVERLER